MRRGALAIAVLAALVVPAPARAGTFTDETHAGHLVKVYAPDGLGATPPLVVMLHGCTQTAAGFADATQMNLVADDAKFIVAYPEQPASAGTTQCWSWYDAAQQTRAGTEPTAIATIADEIATARAVDRARIYVAGLSAGAGMTVIMGATYPDVFAAIGAASGFEFAAAANLGDMIAAAQQGGPDPAVQGDLAYKAMGAAARVVPTIVFQGTADTLVAKVNGVQVAAQWQKTNDLAIDGIANLDVTGPVTSSGTAGGYAFDRSTYAAKGALVIDMYMVTGMGHAWSGGKAGGSFSDPKGPDASRLMWAFFADHPKGTLGPPAPTEGDAGTGADGGAKPGADAGAGEAGADADASASGAPGTGSDSGCACAVGSTEKGAPLFLLCGAVAFVLRRRKR